MFAYDAEAVESTVTDDFVYTIHGIGEYKGKEGIEKLLEDMKQSKITRFEVTDVLHSDNRVAVQGTVGLEGGTNMMFGEFLVFSANGDETLVQRADSYTVMAS